MMLVRVQWVAVLAAMAGLMALGGCGGGGGAPPPVPSIGDSVPKLGPKEGGTLLTVTGSNFTPDMEVTLAETPVVDFTFIDSNTFTCLTPAVAGGTRAGFIIKNANGVTFKLDMFFFIPAPEVSSVSPNFGKPEGLIPVTITGKGFVEYNAGTNVVMFGALPATNVVTSSDTVITCTIPPGNGPTDVSVTNNNGTGTLTRGYRYFPPPTVSRATPGAGTPLGGTAIVITGTGFTANNPGSPTVLIGGRAASDIVAVNDTTITCKTPNGTPGPVDIEVTNSNGSSLAAGAFTYFPFPTVSAVTPDNGSQEGGVSVTITGTGFVNNSAGVNTVRIDGQAVTNMVVQSDTEITCDTPATTAGSKTVEVTNNNGTGSLANGYHANLVALVGSDGPDLYQINPTNGNATRIGAIGFTVTAMAADANGVVWAITKSGDLITINTSTGVGTKVATLGNRPTTMPGEMTFWGTRLLAANFFGETFEIDTTTGSMSSLARFPYWAFLGPGWRQAIEYDPVGDQLLYTPGYEADWYAINPDSGAYTVNSWSTVGNHATAVLAFWKGTMYMIDVARGSSGASRTFYTIDSGLGSLTAVGGTSMVAMTGTE